MLIGTLFPGNAEVVATVYRGLSTELLQGLEYRKEGCWCSIPTAHLSGSLRLLGRELAAACCLLNHRSEICYLWEIIKDLSFSRLPLVKWVCFLSKWGSMFCFFFPFVAFKLPFVYTLPSSSEYIYKRSKAPNHSECSPFPPRWCVEYVHRWKKLGCWRFDGIHQS